MIGGPPLALLLVLVLVVLFLVVVLIVNMRLQDSRIGRAWQAIREDEIAARAMGINTTAVKLLAFAMGASFGGIAGGMFASMQSFISPESFTFIESAIILAIVVLGGLGSQLGVAIAAIVMIGGFELFREFDEWRMLIFGGVMVAIMVLRPRGLVGTRTPTIALGERRKISAALVQEGRG
jgi:branched-chain amino acid transport system permease protein